MKALESEEKQGDWWRVHIGLKKGRWEHQKQVQVSGTVSPGPSPVPMGAWVHTRYLAVFLARGSRKAKSLTWGATVFRAWLGSHVGDGSQTPVSTQSYRQKDQEGQTPDNKSSNPACLSLYEGLPHSPPDPSTYILVARTMSRGRPLSDGAAQEEILLFLLLMFVYI